VLPGLESPTGKKVYTVGAVVAIFLAVVRLSCSSTGGGGKVTYTIACDECGFAEQRALPAGGGSLPLTCPNCGARAVWLSTPCPFCHKDLPHIGKKQPKKCKYCGKELPDD
jgi:DNA-directed RNA polymerase subunit RPC12/RpoP